MVQIAEKPRYTIKNYIDYLEDAYLFVGAKRYDVKGKKYYS